MSRIVLEKGWCLDSTADNAYELLKRQPNGWHVVKRTENPAELAQFVTAYYPGLAPRVRKALNIRDL